MNKYQEAFYEIITALKKDDLYMGDSSYDFIDKYDIKLIQELVDKATPNIYYEHITGEGANSIFAPICPNCKEQLDDYEKHNYCQSCGQRLDWSEDE